MHIVLGVTVVVVIATGFDAVFHALPVVVADGVKEAKGLEARSFEVLAHHFFELVLG